jgi:hypothetical protein
MQKAKESIGNHNGHEDFEKDQDQDGPEFIEERKELIEDLFEKAEDYVQTNIELIKLKAVDRVSEIVSSVVAYVAVIVFGFFCLVMFNIAIALWIGYALDNNLYGFLIVAGFYGLLTLMVYASRKSIIKKPVSNSIISQFLK